MRRAVALFLFIILPLQVTFAVAAEYCGIEKQESAQHFGHHSDGDSAQPEEPAPAGDNKADCQFCALACAHAQASSFSFVCEKRADAPAAREISLPAGHSPPVFERPPRHLLA